MGNKSKNSKKIYQKQDGLMGKEINVVPKPKPELGIDQNQVILDQILNASDGVAGDGLNIQKIESFCHISQNRNQIYDLIDTMAEDPTISATLEIYCEDATETNNLGQVMWVESNDEEVAHYVNYLLSELNVEKNMYRWVNCLVKYGDVYLRLYHQSEYEDGLFDDFEKEDIRKTYSEKQNLNEDVILTTFRPSDNFVHYLNMVPNPAEMFELTRFGKTYAYIQAPVTAYMNKKKDTNLAYGNYTYNFRKKDVHIFTADNFVHGCLEDMTSREPEEVNLFSGDDNDPSSVKYHYDVRKGQSIFYNTYKIWRENMLLEYALLLNRLSRSQAVKIVNVEVADMPKNQVNAKLNAVKQLFEQKTALATDQGMNEYNNSGPAENIIYTASRNGKGAISVQDVTSDLNVSGLDDVNLFRKKLYSSIKIPPQYLGDTDDAGGFDGGTSLSLISSRYAKTIKRIQNVMIQTITDAINIMLVDNGYMSYINKYRLRMQEPTTQEENDRQDNLVNRITTVQNTMSLFDDIQDVSSRLKILKSLVGSVISEPKILSEIEQQIDKQLAVEKLEQGQSGIDDSEFGDMSLPGGGGGGIDMGPTDMGPSPDVGVDLGGESDMGPSADSGGADMGGSPLPSPADIGIDAVNM